MNDEVNKIKDLLVKVMEVGICLNICTWCWMLMYCSEHP